MPSQFKPKPVLPSLIKTVWYLGFTKTTGPVKWWHWFTRENFRHVYMYTQVGGDTWLAISMTRGGLVITQFSELEALKLGYTSIHQFLQHLWDGFHTVPAWGMVYSAVSIPRRAPFTCVELARSLLGIDKMLYTPWQLYNYVVKNRLANHAVRATLSTEPAE